MDGRALQRRASERAKQLPGSYLDHPFGDEWDVHKVRGKVFMLQTELDGEPVITVKAHPDDALALRSTHASIAVGYHMNKAGRSAATRVAQTSTVTAERDILTSGSAEPTANVTAIATDVSATITWTPRRRANAVRRATSGCPSGSSGSLTRATTAQRIALPTTRARPSSGPASAAAQDLATHPSTSPSAVPHAFTDTSATYRPPSSRTRSMLHKPTTNRWSESNRASLRQTQCGSGAVHAFLPRSMPPNST